MSRIFALCSLCLLFVSANALCQTDTIVTFHDSDWKKITDSIKAEYKRVGYRHDIGFWKVTDYYKNGQVAMTGAFSDEDMRWRHGLFEWFYPSGQLMSRRTYSNRIPVREVGESFDYYENGQLDTYQRFDSLGEIEEERFYKEDGTESVREHPEFPGGITGLYQYLSDHIKYPKSLLRRGITGKVFVTFTVNTDGTLQDIAIIDSPDEAFSKAAIKVVNSMPRWKPGLKDNEPVRVKYNLPITFTF